MIEQALSIHGRVDEAHTGFEQDDLLPAHVPGPVGHAIHPVLARIFQRRYQCSKLR